MRGVQVNVVVPVEQRFLRTPDGAVWTEGAFGHSFWANYRTVFDGVRVVARVRDIPSVPPQAALVGGAGVTVAAVPHYIGPWQFARRAWRVRRAARAAVGPGDALILRVPSTLANCIAPQLWRTDRPYGVEVVGDPRDAYAPGALEHPLRRFFGWWFTTRARRQCMGACAVAYVTRDFLQQGYPAGPGALSTSYSDVELPPQAFVAQPRQCSEGKRSFTLIMVGVLAQPHKRADVLIDGVAACVRDGLDLKLLLVGDGRYRAGLQAQARALGLGDRVSFLGQVRAGDAVRALLDAADLFVLVSQQEGLPRAMVEAMARALPCIGTTVGGIPELLPREDLVPPGDVATLARKIRELVTDPERMARASARNLRQATAYRDDVRRERRLAFYGHVRERTEAWLRTQGRGTPLRSDADGRQPTPL